MDAPRDYEALKTVDFIVNADPVLTPLSAAVADVLLPVAMSCERNSARTWWTPVRTMYRAVEPAGEAKTDEQIVVDLMPRLNPEAAASFGWTKDTDIADWYLAGGDGKKHGASSNVKGNISEKAKGGCGMRFRQLSEKGATPTTTGTTPTRNMPRACCATTAIPASPRLPAASSWRPTRTASGASRPRRSIPSLPKAP